MFLKIHIYHIKIVVSVTKAQFFLISLYNIFLCVNKKNTYCLYQQEAHVGHCGSPEYNERVKNLTSEWNQKQQSFVKNLTSEWNQKQQSFIPHASRSLLCIRFVAVAFWAKKQFF